MRVNVVVDKSVERLPVQINSLIIFKACCIFPSVHIIRFGVTLCLMGPIVS